MRGELKKMKGGEKTAEKRKYKIEGTAAPKVMVTFGASITKGDGGIIKEYRLNSA